MQYFTTHYWRSGEKNTSSLVLQQVYHKRKRMPVLLACIQKDGQKENGFSRELVDWFYGKGLELCSKNGEGEIEATESSLSDFLKQAVCGEIIGILIVGRCFIMFQQGSRGISLLNTRNHRSNYQDLSLARTDAMELCSQTGMIQRGVGILLATDSFYEGISRNMIEECLNVRELRSQNQVDKRLRELGSVAERYDKTDQKSIGAVLIVAR